MDETISSIIQIGELMFRIGKGIADAVIKAYQNAYYGQWYGQADFQKLQKIAGSHISYLEIKSQDPVVLNRVQSQIFDKYKVLYSPLPDLNGSDGAVQYGFHGDQIESLRAGLNQYNIEKLQKLAEAKEQFGVGTSEYFDAKAKIEAEYPEIRSITSEDYVITRLDEQGQETPEYKALEKSAKEEMKKLNLPEPEEPLEDRVIQFQDAKKKADYEALIKEGKAQRLAVAECETEYMAIAGKEVPFYHAKISDNESVVLPPSARIDDKSIVVLHDKRYPIVSVDSAIIAKRSGKEVTEQLAKHSAQKIAGKVAKEAVKKGVKTGAIAAKCNPYTAAAEKAAEATIGTVKKIGEISTGKKR